MADRSPPPASCVGARAQSAERGNLERILDCQRGHDRAVLRGLLQQVAAQSEVERHAPPVTTAISSTRFVLTPLATQAVHSIPRDDVEHGMTPPPRAPGIQGKRLLALRTILNSAVEDGSLTWARRIRGAGQALSRHQVRLRDFRDELETITELRRADVDTRQGVLRIGRGVILLEAPPS